MKFIEKFTLACRGPIEQLEDEVASNTLLVGDRVVTEWEEGHSSSGYDYVRLLPAYYGGRRSWLITRRWCPDDGYSAERHEEQVVDLEIGLRMIVEHGCIDDLFPPQPEPTAVKMNGRPRTAICYDAGRDSGITWVRGRKLSIDADGRVTAIVDAPLEWTDSELQREAVHVEGLCDSEVGSVLPEHEADAIRRWRS